MVSLPGIWAISLVNRYDVTNCFLRQSVNKLAVPLPRTNFFKNNFSYGGEVPWNSLPYDLRQAESLGDFLYKLYTCTLFQ